MSRREDFSSNETGSPSISEPDPGSGEYVKTPALSKRTASRNSLTSRKSFSSSPGNPDDEGRAGGDVRDDRANLLKLLPVARRAPASLHRGKHPPRHVL